MVIFCGFVDCICIVYIQIVLFSEGVFLGLGGGLADNSYERGVICFRYGFYGFWTGVLLGRCLPFLTV